jgi:hypothetical protein
MRFAHLKTHHGFERLRLRGLSGARDEFHLAAIVQNLKTLALRLLKLPQPVLVLKLVSKGALRPCGPSTAINKLSAPNDNRSKAHQPFRLFRQHRPISDVRASRLLQCKFISERHFVASNSLL